MRIAKKINLVYDQTEHFIKLHGLYKVVLDLEESDEYGDMNTGNIIWQFPTKKLTGYKLELIIQELE